MKGMRILLLVLLMNLPIISKAFSPVDSIGVENVKGEGEGEGEGEREREKRKRIKRRFARCPSLTGR